jgi:hypothetical protein
MMKKATPLSFNGQPTSLQVGDRLVYHIGSLNLSFKRGGEGIMIGGADSLTIGLKGADPEEKVDWITRLSYLLESMLPADLVLDGPYAEEKGKPTWYWTVAPSK